MQPCEQVFKETAKAANPYSDFSKSEEALSEFAKAACKTSNPDALWLIAQQETNFRFEIVRINGAESRILYDQEARDYLNSVRTTKDKDLANVDIGVLQFNWFWHKGAFRNNVNTAFSPKAQVEYFIKKFGNEIAERCNDQWIGCYHNQSNAEISARYQSRILNKNKILAEQMFKYINDFRAKLSADERKILPGFRKQDFFKVMEAHQDLALPHQEILPFVDSSPNFDTHLIEAANAQS
jgi:hypothetical protein